MQKLTPKIYQKLLDIKKDQLTPKIYQKLLDIKKDQNTVLWTYVIFLNSKEIVGTFYEKELQKLKRV